MLASPDNTRAFAPLALTLFRLRSVLARVRSRGPGTFLLCCGPRIIRRVHSNNAHRRRGSWHDHNNDNSSARTHANRGPGLLHWDPGPTPDALGGRFRCSASGPGDSHLVYAARPDLVYGCGHLAAFSGDGKKTHPGKSRRCGCYIQRSAITRRKDGEGTVMSRDGATVQINIWCRLARCSSENRAG